MVKIRFARFGTKKRPYYHLVVTDSENARDGRYIERIGLYDPKNPMDKATVDHGRLGHWVGLGAQLSPSLQKVVREQAKSAAAAAA
jgi:small subunit ribosomal protein S16